MTIRIYVACLASYNNGKLHGRWIDCDGLDADGIQEEVNAMLAESPEHDAEEWAIHDYESPVPLGEWESFDRIAELAEKFEDEDAALKLTYLLEVEGYSIEQALASDLDDVHINEPEYTSGTDDYILGVYMWEAAGLDEGLPEHARNYIDHEAYGRDCRHDGAHVWRHEGTVYIVENQT